MPTKKIETSPDAVESIATERHWKGNMCCESYMKMLVLNCCNIWCGKIPEAVLLPLSFTLYAHKRYSAEEQIMWYVYIICLLRPIMP